MAAVCCLLAAVVPAHADEFLRGYASALLERSEPALELIVLGSDEPGRVVLQAPRCLDAAERLRVETALLAGDRLRGVDWDLPCAPAAVSPVAGPPPEVPPTLQPLPQYQLFDWLLADPREAGFNASWQRHRGGPETFNAGSVAFGSYFGFLDRSSGRDRWQLGLQGAVFALFNLDAESTDLVNADYWIGLPLTYRHNRWSYRARLYHQSSHLGDEFLLGNADIERVNLSYEALDALAAYDWKGLRAYAGGGVIVRSEPNLDPWQLHYGIEYRYAEVLGPLDLLAGIDVQRHQEQGWEPNRSTRVGFGYRRGSRSVALLLEYYRGNSTNGQFFDVPLNYVGLGLYFGL